MIVCFYFKLIIQLQLTLQEFLLEISHQKCILTWFLDPCSKLSSGLVETDGWGNPWPKGLRESGIEPWIIYLLVDVVSRSAMVTP